MFYQKLKKLRNYNISESEIDKLKKILINIPKERISPLLIAKKLGINVNSAFYICMSLVKEELASIRYEITCPECSADVIVVNSLKELQKEYDCDVCGEHFILSSNDIWVTFDFFHKTKIIKQEDKFCKDKALRIDNAFKNPLFQQMADDQLFNIDRDKLKDFLNSVENAKTNDEKKKSLENLSEYLFSSIYGIKVIEKNKRTETSEIDLILELDHPIFGLHPFFREMGCHIMLECKNWSNPVGASIIRNFSRDMKKRKVYWGCLISKREISKDAKKEIKDLFIDEKISIIHLSKKDIEDIIKGENLIELLKKKYRKIKFF